MNDDLTSVVLDHGHVTLLNLAGPVRRPEQRFDADDIDPALVARTSFDDKEGRSRELELNLVEYLMDHRHTTPIEMIECWFEMKLPILVARHLVRHRTVSINEVSGRYVILPNEFYIPDLENVGVKSAKIKQGRKLGEMTKAEIAVAEGYRHSLRLHCEQSYDLYIGYANNGIANELARAVLPVNFYTRWIWKQDLHNLMHMLRLRMDSHAMYETRQYADAICAMMKTYLPFLMGYLEENM